MRIAVLGASGTIGCALVPLLAEEHEVVAITRRPHQQSNGFRWAQADATDADSVQRAFEGVDVAYYLVHSLGSTDFAERDRLAALVVAGAAERAGCASWSTWVDSATSHPSFRATCVVAPRRESCSHHDPRR